MLRIMNRRLYRSRTDTVLAGVASGLAAYLGADPALVRIAWAILVPLTGGAAFLAYIVAWIVVPEEPYPGAAFGAPAGPTGPAASAMPGAGSTGGDEAAGMEPGTDPVTGAPIQPVAGSGSTWTPPPPIERRSSDGRAGMVIGLGLVVLGLWFLLREYLPDFRWNLVWPFAIVAIGALILFSAMRRRDG
jgi:phage shock protein PspC (stress-responsive transcriptional regulator)